MHTHISAGLGSRQGPGCPHTVPPIDRAGTRQLITTPIPGSSTDYSDRGCISDSRCPMPAKELPSGAAHYVHRAQSRI